MDNINSGLQNFQKSDVSVFWGELAPCDHVLQIYENDGCFLSTLEEFVCNGLNNKESVILIATNLHLQDMSNRLLKRGFDLPSLQKSKGYNALNATEMISKFMVNGWPDEELFNTLINDIINQARQYSPKVRAFGEMVALLWAEGKNGATVRLEKLWNQLHHKQSFTLYCAYPRTGFTQNAHDSITTICEAHHHIIDGHLSGGNIIYHRDGALKTRKH